MRILYIDCDSLRPDHLGCYGYHRDTSPNVDRLAAEGRRFTNYYAADTPCNPSRTGLYTGRFGIHTGVVDHGGLYADPRRHGNDRRFSYPGKFRSWIGAMKAAGLDTVMVSPFPARHDAWQVLEGVTEFYDVGAGGSDSADVIYTGAEPWLDDHAAEDDWFLTVNFWDPHTPYDTPESYGDPFANDPAPDWLTDEMIRERYESYGPHSAHVPHSASADFSGVRDLPRTPDAIESREDYVRWINGYDTGIRYMDDYIGRLLDLLESKGVREETLILVSADHGEQQGELNVWGDHHLADHATARVPLIATGPGVEPGVDDDLHYQLDLPPTVMDLLGAESPAGWDGESFAPSLAAGESAGRDYLVVSNMAWACQRGVRWDDWMLLRTYHDGLKQWVNDVMLFDLSVDPHETTNLAGERPDVVEEGLAKLGRWVDDRLGEAANGERGGNPGTPDGVTDPLWEVLRAGGPFHTRGREAKYAAHLRDVGREEQAAEIEATYLD